MSKEGEGGECGKVGQRIQLLWICEGKRWRGCAESRRPSRVRRVWQQERRRLSKAGKRGDCGKKDQCIKIVSICWGQQGRGCSSSSRVCVRQVVSSRQTGEEASQSRQQRRRPSREHLVKRRPACPLRVHW